MSFLEFKEVSKRFGDKQAVDNVNLSVQEGAFLTLLGPSGSGKTTLLTMLAGFTEPDRGRICIGGRDVTSLPPEQRGLGIVFQGYALFPHMTVFENIAYALRIRRMDKAALERRVAEMVDLVQLGGLERRRPTELSGGQQQRVALARALAFDPPVLLLDEPLSALDRLLRGQLQDELKRLHRTIGKTFVFVTHDQDEALAMSTDIAVLRDGRIEQFGSPHALYAHPATRFVAGFLGVNNLLTPEVLGADDGLTVCRAGEEKWKAPSNPDRADTLAIRAEDIQISTERHTGSNSVAVRVTQADYHGDIYTLDLEIVEGVALKAKVSARNVGDARIEGARVYANWRPEDSVWIGSRA